jgi:hypothetical protein
MKTMAVEYTAQDRDGIRFFGTLLIDIKEISNARYTAAKLRAEQYLKLTGYRAIFIEEIYEA